MERQPRLRQPCRRRGRPTALLETSYFSLFRSGHEPAVAARALLDVCGPEHFGRVVHSTSGSAANDLTMKLARQYWALHRQFRRRVIVGLKGSYHGLTYGSHGLTGMSLGQSYYGVDQRLIRHVSHEDPAELEELLRAEGEQIAAVVVEPVLGTGALPLPEPMLAALARLRAEYGFLLVADEVATGFGRTGSYFASQNWPEPPDIMLASKGMTNGTCAAAAVVVSHAVCDVFDRHDAALTHAETQAGAPPPAPRSSPPSRRWSACGRWSRPPPSAPSWTACSPSWPPIRWSRATTASAASGRCGSAPTAPTCRTRPCGRSSRRSGRPGRWCRPGPAASSSPPPWCTRTPTWSCSPPRCAPAWTAPPSGCSPGRRPAHDRRSDRHAAPGRGPGPPARRRGGLELPGAARTAL
ncbi:aminotransferase class III-fold pyridoxal phosphate-dependent enzyme [Kitasatospora aburaviensis]